MIDTISAPPRRTNIDRFKAADTKRMVFLGKNGWAMATITGTFGDDILTGTSGDDIIIGRSGADTLTGGAGADIFVYNSATSNDGPFGDDIITDFRQGEDKIDLSALFVGDLATLAPVISQVGSDTRISLRYNGNSESITIRNILPSQLTAADFIFATSTAGRTVTGNSSDDVLIGGSGDDTITDTFTGNNVFLAGAGNDRLIGGSGNETLYGQGGADTFVFNAYAGTGSFLTFGNDVIADFTQGQDRIDLSGMHIGAFAQLSVVLSQVGGNAVISATYSGQPATITILGVTAASLTAQDFVFDTSTAAVTVTSSGRGDTLFAGLGNDTLDAAGANGLGAGLDVLIGGVGDNVLIGSQGPNKLYGFEGNDRLIENGGNDVMTGGSGADTFVFGRGVNSNFGAGAISPIYIGSIGNDIITDFVPGEYKIDLSRRGVSAMAQIVPFMARSGNDTIIVLPGSAAETITLKGVLPAQLSARDFVFDTSTAAHTTNPPSVSGVVLFDSLGADTIRGTGSGDIFMLSAGNDTLTGAGGSGTDVYVVPTTGIGHDIINDFVVRNAGGFGDAIDLSAIGVSSFSAFRALLSQDGPDTIVTLPGSGGADTITLYNVTASQLTAANVIYLGQANGITFENRSSNETVFGTARDDTFQAGIGDDRFWGGRGIDTALFNGTRASATVTHNADGTTTVVSRDGTDTLSGTELFQFFDGTYSFRFGAASAPVVANFNPANGWSSQDKYPRHAADVNGDGYADIVGFGQAGTLVSFGSATGTFAGPVTAAADFGQAQGWSSDNAFHRELIDVNKDGRADIVGFGIGGVLVSLAQANGSFTTPVLGSSNFNAANGWSNQDSFTRTLGDVNGDGRADVIGFGIGGTFVALGRGDGTFGTANFALANFGANQGWTSDNTYHRTVADVNGDGRADIVGFGIAGTLVALGQADGSFAAPTLAQANFGANQGWSSQDAFTRVTGDVNGDGMADVVGFGIAGTYVSYGQADGSLSTAGFDVANFGANQGWTSDGTYHRELADLNHDGQVDVFGFGIAGVLTSTSAIDLWL